MHFVRWALCRLLGTAQIQLKECATVAAPSLPSSSSSSSNASFNSLLNDPNDHAHLPSPTDTLPTTGLDKSLDFPCNFPGQGLDLAIVLDGSNSVSDPQFLAAKSGIARIISDFASSDTHLAVVQASGNGPHAAEMDRHGLDGPLITTVVGFGDPFSDDLSRLTFTVEQVLVRGGFVY